MTKDEHEVEARREDKRPKKKPPKEATEQQRLVAYLRTRGWWFTATANGVAMSPRQRNDFARQGGSRGLPDLLVFEAVGGFTGLAIELKRAKGGATRPEQLRWRDALTARGWLAVIARGCDEAVRMIEEVEK